MRIIKTSYVNLQIALHFLNNKTIFFDFEGEDNLMNFSSLEEGK